MMCIYHSPDGVGTIDPDGHPSPSSMSARHRADILRAFTYFSPASLAIIARIEHMEQVKNMELYCAQLVEDGLLDRHLSPEGIEEYSLSAAGRSIVPSDRLVIPTTKQTIYVQLKSREIRNMHLRRRIVALLRPGYMTLLQIHHLLGDNLTLAEVSSVLYGLMCTNQVDVCGPLYGWVPTSKNNS